MDHRKRAVQQSASASAGRANPRRFELKRVALDFFVGAGLGFVVSAAAVPELPEVSCVLMPGVIVVGVCDEPVADAGVDLGEEPDDTGVPAE